MPIADEHGPDQERIPVRRHRLPDVHSYDVTADELDQIESDSTGVGQDFSFASIALTAMISFGVVLLTGQVTSPRLWDAFFLLTLVAGVVTAYCGIRWNRGRKGGMRVIERIRQRQEAPFGEQGKELKPADLDRLPAQAPTTQAPTSGGAGE